MTQNRRAGHPRRAVGPPGAEPAGPEPRAEQDRTHDAEDDDERFRAERPPHHEPRD